MGVSSTLIQAIVCVCVFLVMGQLGTINALRCFNCAFSMPLDGEPIYIPEVTEWYLNELFYEDLTCFGNHPDPSLSVDCSVPRKLSRLKNVENLKNLDETQGNNKTKFTQIDSNITYVCRHEIYKERLPAGVQLTTFRSCGHANIDINEAMDKINQQMNTTSIGYICDTDNCNNRILYEDENEMNRNGSTSGSKTTMVVSTSFISMTVLVKIL